MEKNNNEINNSRKPVVVIAKIGSMARNRGYRKSFGAFIDYVAYLNIRRVTKITKNRKKIKRKGSK